MEFSPACLSFFNPLAQSQGFPVAKSYIHHSLMKGDGQLVLLPSKMADMSHFLPSSPNLLQQQLNYQVYFKKLFHNQNF